MTFQHTHIVRFQETDAAGVVYFANILTICHEAYESSLAASGISLKVFFSTTDYAVPIVRANVEFFYPLHCGDRLTIHLTPQPLTSESFEVSYEIFLGNRLAAKATTKHVCIDAETRQKRSLSEELTHWLTNLGESVGELKSSDTLD